MGGVTPGPTYPLGQQNNASRIQIPDTARVPDVLRAPHNSGDGRSSRRPLGRSCARGERRRRACVRGWPLQASCCCPAASPWHHCRPTRARRPSAICLILSRPTVDVSACLTMMLSVQVSSRLCTSKCVFRVLYRCAPPKSKRVSRRDLMDPIGKRPCFRHRKWRRSSTSVWR